MRTPVIRLTDRSPRHPFAAAKRTRRLAPGPSPFHRRHAGIARRPGILNDEPRVNGSGHPTRYNQDMVFVRGPFAALLALLLASAGPGADEGTGDPFMFFRPTVTLTSGDRARLNQGRSIVRLLPAVDTQLGIFAATRVRTDAATFRAHFQRIADLKRGPMVQQIRRFSDPPALSDLAELRMDPGDRSDLESCRPGDCGLKLSAREMAQLVPLAKSRRASAQQALDAALRVMVFERVTHYLEGGQALLEPYHDQDEPIDLGVRFDRLVSTTPFLSARPDSVDSLRHLRHPEADAGETFLYWSVEHFGRKPVVIVTHVNIIRGDGVSLDILVTSRQVFATHYTNASLGVTALLQDQGGRNAYLAYVNRSDVDAFGGMLGWLRRALVERRIRSEADDVLDVIRQRVERPVPPG